MNDERKPTPHQQIALRKILDWWNLPASHPNWKNCVLSAPAGSGKTFIAKYATQEMKDVFPIFSATTNEAARQLGLAGVTVAGTTHSVMGLSPKTDQEIPYFIQLRVPEGLYDHNLIVVDEASMAGMATDNNPDLIVDYAEAMSAHRFLWIGDSYQLPPVESVNGIAPVFEQSWATATLTDIMRNSGDILEYCTLLRGAIDSNIRRLPRVPKSDCISSINHAQLYSMLRSPDQLENFRTGATRNIVWRNATADRLNQIIREGLHGKDATESDLLPTDQILFTSPLMTGSFPSDPDHLIGWKDAKQGASTNSRAEVIAIVPRELYGIPCNLVKFRLETSIEVMGFIPTAEGQRKLAKLKASFVKSLSSYKSASAKANKWKWWHAFYSCFGQIKHAYAITTHRAQGSNIDNVIVDVKDILDCRESLLAYKLLYTACSRTKKHLTLVREV